ncbi:MAG: LapA family protein [Gammaproteobacteria bacterium]
MIRLTYIIFSLILLIIGILFAVLNADPVTLHYYFGEKDIPLSLVLIIAIITGAILGVIASAGVIVKLKREKAKLRKLTELSEKELKNLRTLPIKDEH